MSPLRSRPPLPAVLLAAAIGLFASCRGPAAPEAAHDDHHEDGGGDAVRLTPEAVAASGIAAAVVSRQAFHPHVVASGVIRPPSAGSVSVRAPLAGRVVRVLAAVGDRVRRGQPLASLDSPDLSAAVARRRAAEARLGAVEAALGRGRRLLDLGAMSRAEVEAREAEAAAARAEAGAARSDLARLGFADGDDDGALLAIVAPGPGVVLGLAVAPGLLVERDAPLFEVADLGAVWAVADVHEKDLGRIAGAGEAEVHAAAFPGETFTGRIALVEPALDETSRTAHVRVVLDNPGGRLRPGMFVTVSVPLAADSTDAAAVPAAAVQRIGGLPLVFVERGAGEYEPRPVEIGRESHGLVEILRGLSEGERVVIEGAFVLKSEILKRTIAGDDH